MLTRLTAPIAQLFDSRLIDGGFLVGLSIGETDSSPSSGDLSCSTLSSAALTSLSPQASIVTDHHFRPRYSRRPQTAPLHSRTLLRPALHRDLSIDIQGHPLSCPSLICLPSVRVRIEAAQGGVRPI